MELRNRFEALNHSDDEVEGIYVETAENILGLREIKKKNWISEEIWTKIQKRKNIKMMLNRSKPRIKKLKFEENQAADTKRDTNPTDTRRCDKEAEKAMERPQNKDEIEKKSSQKYKKR
jgi:hypothetical protein